MARGQAATGKPSSLSAALLLIKATHTVWFTERKGLPGALPPAPQSQEVKVLGALASFTEEVLLGVTTKFGHSKFD